MCTYQCVHTTDKCFDFAEKFKKKQEIGEILQASLKRALEQKKANERLKQRQKAKTKLAIEQPFGLFRPDNMKLIHKTFKQEDLYNEHKALLERNTSRAQVAQPTVAGNSRLQGRLHAFLNNSS